MINKHSKEHLTFFSLIPHNSIFYFHTQRFTYSCRLLTNLQRTKILLFLWNVFFLCYSLRYLIHRRFIHPYHKKKLYVFHPTIPPPPNTQIIIMITHTYLLKYANFFSNVLYLTRLSLFYFFFVCFKVH